MREKKSIVCGQWGTEHFITWPCGAENQLIQRGRYTDCVDELIFKLVNAPVKRITTMKELNLK